jgi:hypothetical protein
MLLGNLASAARVSWARVAHRFESRRRVRPEGLRTLFSSAEPTSAWCIVRCIVAALVLTASVYPDVIFCGASLSTANVVNVTLGPARHSVQFFPEREGREAYHGYYDTGGSTFQSEPSAQFVTRTLWNGQSIYWNPYSAGGSYGIETLVDIKTSPLTMVVALLGGSDAAFHIVYLAFCALGTLCLLLLWTVEFRLSFLAALAGGVTYLLNGYCVTNLLSNYSQTWLYFPIFALGLVSFARSPRVAAFLCAAAGATLILATTFLPTTLLVAGTTMLVGMAAAAGFAAVRSESRGEAVRQFVVIVVGQAAAVALAFASLAIVYLPVFEAFRYMNTGDYYADRRFFPASLVNFITLFTPKHAFEAYSAASARAVELRGNVAFHQGIVGSLLVTQAIRAWPLFHRIVLAVMGAALLALVARVYGFPGVAAVVDPLPIIGHFGEQYLWVSIGVLFTLLLPFGLEAVSRDGARVAPLIGTALVITGSLAYTTSVYKIDGVDALRYITIAACLVILTVLVILNFHRPRRRAGLALLLVLLSWAELTFYVDHERLSRVERFAEPPPFVGFLQLQGGLHRVASFGYWGIPPEYGSAYGIYQIGSMNFQLFPRYEDVFNRLILPDEKDRWPTFATLVRARDTPRINLPAFDFLGARRLIIPVLYPLLRGFMDRSDWRRVYEDSYFVIFENPSPLPRAFITHRIVRDPLTPIDEGQSPLALVTTDDEDFISAAEKVGLSDRPGLSAASEETAVITRYDNDRVVIQATVRAPGILVLNDVWHPNWTVTVDESPSYLGRVDEVFRGVILQPGHHVVEMQYAPRSLTTARLVTLGALLLALVMWMIRRKLDSLLRRLVGLNLCRATRAC